MARLAGSGTERVEKRMSSGAESPGSCRRPNLISAEAPGAIITAKEQSVQSVAIAEFTRSRISVPSKYARNSLGVPAKVF